MTSSKNINTIRILQKKCLRIMNFSVFNSHTNPLFIQNRLLKLDDIIESSRLQLIFEFTNKNLSEDLCNLFNFTVDVHTHNTRVMHKGLFIPSINTSNFGNKSLRFSAPMLWNNFIKSYPDILNFKHKSQLKFYLKKIYYSKYISV